MPHREQVGLVVQYAKHLEWQNRDAILRGRWRCGELQSNSPRPPQWSALALRVGWIVNPSYVTASLHDTAARFESSVPILNRDTIYEGKMVIICKECQII